MKRNTDKEFVNLLIARDNNAWDLFYKKYRPYIRGAVAKVFGAARIVVDVDDITQDVCLELLESHLSRWDSRSSFSTWVTLRAQDRAKDALKRHQAEDRWPDMNEKSLLFPDVNAGPIKYEDRPAYVYQTEYAAFSGMSWYWADWMFGPARA